MNPLVSIIIPTYNRAHLIGETLDSVVAQTYTNWECIVVDDGSTDATNELMASYCDKDSRIKYFHRPKDRSKGANACRNYGFELSRGEYVNWFDSDDIMNPDLLKFKMNLFISKPEIGFVVCGFRILKSNGDIKVFKMPMVDNHLEGYLNDKLVLNTFNILWRRVDVENQSWDESLHKFQDLDFVFRLLISEKLMGGSIDMSLIDVKDHLESISKTNNFENNISRLQVRKMMYLSSKKSLSKDMQRRLYHLYLFEFKNLLSIGDYKLCINELKENFIKDKMVKLNLLMFVFIYMFTKRGMSRFKNYLIKIST